MNYERYCEDPAVALASLGAASGLRFELHGLAPYTPPRRKADDIDPKLLEHSDALYDKLSVAAVNL
jgi:hypothetical protein